MRRIGYVLKKFPRLSETFILTELLALEERGASLVVYSLRAPDDEPAHPELARLRAPIRRVARPGASDGELAEQVATFARGDGVSHLHAHFATIAARVASRAAATLGVTYSITAHAKDLYRTGVDRQALDALARGAKAFVTVCDANVAHLRRCLGPEAIARVRRIYNGIDVEAFAADGDGSGRDGDPIVLAVARLVPKKGLIHLLEAAAALARAAVPFRLRIVGDGEQRAELEVRARSLGVEQHVAFTGALPSDRVRRELKAATLFCLPCVSDADGNQDALPTVLLEAQAAGVPCISTSIGGVPEILDHGRAGVIVAPADSAALAEAMATLLRDPARRAQLAAAGAAQVRQLFSRARAAAELAALFEAA